MNAATLQALLGTGAFALLLGAFGPALDAEPYPAAPAVDPVDNVALAVAASRAADLAQCQAQYGPNASAVHLPDGQHRCTNKHGRRLPTTGQVTAQR